LNNQTVDLIINVHVFLCVLVGEGI